MDPSIGGLPETQDLVRWLQEQAVKNKGYSTPYPSTIGVPSTIYSHPQLAENAEMARPFTGPQMAEANTAPATPATEASAGQVGKLRGAGLLNTAIIAALSGPVSDFGTSMGYKLRQAAGKAPFDARSQQLHDSATYGSSLPSVEEVMASPSASHADRLPLPLRDPSRVPAYEMQQTMDSLPPEVHRAVIDHISSPDSARVHFTAPVAPVTVDLGDSTAQEDVPVSTIPAYSPMASASLDDHIAQLLAHRQEMPVDTAAQSQAVMEKLVQPKVVAPPPEKETFGHKLKNWMVAGSGPVDFTRLARQELALKQLQQQFTPQEQLQAELAKNDIEGSRAFNRNMQEHRYMTGGLSPQDKIQLEMLSGERRMGMEHGFKNEELGLEHNYRLGEIAQSGAAQKVTPEVLRAQTKQKMLEQYPDIFTPEQIMSETGLQTSPEALKVIANARKKTDMIDLMLADWIQNHGSMGGAGAKPGAAQPQNLNLRALQSQPTKK